MNQKSIFIWECGGLHELIRGSVQVCSNHSINITFLSALIYSLLSVFFFSMWKRWRFTVLNSTFDNWVKLVLNQTIAMKYSVSPSSLFPLKWMFWLLFHLAQWSRDNYWKPFIFSWQNQELATREESLFVTSLSISTLNNAFIFCGQFSIGLQPISLTISQVISSLSKIRKANWRETWSKFKNPNLVSQTLNKFNISLLIFFSKLWFLKMTILT